MPENVLIDDWPEKTESYERLFASVPNMFRFLLDFVQLNISPENTEFHSLKLKTLSLLKYIAGKELLS